MGRATTLFFLNVCQRRCSKPTSNNKTISLYNTFRVCKTAIIRLRISEVHQDGNHKAIAMQSVIKLTGESHP